MAGDWIKVETTTPDKPEVIAMAEILGIDQDAVFGKLMRIWIWADAQTIDGNAGGNGVSVTFAFLDRCTCVTGFGAALEKVGWLIRSEDGRLTFPNFSRHNGSTAKTRALTARRVALHKKGNAKSNAESVTSAHPNALPREEKRRDNKEIATHTRESDKSNSVDSIVTPDDPHIDWISAEAQFLSLWNDSPRTSHRSAIPYSLQREFRTAWLDEDWRQKFASAIARLQTNEFWSGKVVSLKQFLDLSFVPDLLNGVYDGDRNGHGTTGGRGKRPERPTHLAIGEAPRNGRPDSF